MRVLGWTLIFIRTTSRQVEVSSLRVCDVASLRSLTACAVAISEGVAAKQVFSLYEV